MLEATSKKVTPQPSFPSPGIPWPSQTALPLVKPPPGPHQNSSCDKGPGPPLRLRADNSRRLPALSSSAGVCDGPATQDDPPGPGPDAPASYGASPSRPASSSSSSRRPGAFHSLTPSSTWRDSE